MFDHKTVHVDDPKSAVGTRAYLNRPEPAVLRPKKLVVLLVFRSPPPIARCGLFQNQTVNALMNRFAGERVSVVLFAKSLVAVDAQPTPGCWSPWRSGQFETNLFVTGAQFAGAWRGRYGRF